LWGGNTLKPIRSAALLLLAIAIAVSAHAAPAIQWSWSNVNINAPACTTTVKTSCLVGFTLTPPSTLPSTSYPPISIPGLVSTYTQTTQVPPFSSTAYTYSMVANYLDASGNSVASAATTGTVTITPGAPTGLSGTYSSQ
jgi:hypothetical protein